MSNVERMKRIRIAETEQEAYSIISDLAGRQFFNGLQIGIILGVAFILFLTRVI